LIVLFVIYEIIHSFSAGSSKDTTAKQTIKVQAANPIVSKSVTLPKSQSNQTQINALLNPAPFAKQTSATEDVTSNQTNMPQETADTNLDKNLAALKKANEEQLDALSNQQSQNAAQLQNVQDQLSGLGNQVSSMDDSVQSLTSSFNAMRVQERAAQRRAAQAQARKNAAIRHYQQYFVSAVIPGRAWLKSINGKMVTVSVGDKLPGYGKITAINPYSGEVSTTAQKLYYGISGNSE